MNTWLHRTAKSFPPLSSWTRTLPFLSRGTDVHYRAQTPASSSRSINVTCMRCSRRTVEPVSMSLPGSRGKPSGQLAGLCHVPVLLSPVLRAVPQPCLQSCSATPRPAARDGSPAAPGRRVCVLEEGAEYNACCTGATNSLHSFSQAFMPTLPAGKTRQTLG